MLNRFRFKDPRVGGARNYMVLLLGVLGFQVAPAQWAPTAGPEGGTVVQFAAIDSTIFSGTINAVFVSYDHGVKWHSASEGLAGQVVSLVAHDSTLIASTTEGLHRSTDFGKSWASVHGGLPSAVEYALLSFAQYIFAAGDSGIYRSADNGIHWVERNIGLSLDHRFYRTLASSEGIIYVGAGDSAYCSTDSGATWHVDAVFPIGYLKSLVSVRGNLVAEIGGELGSQIWVRSAGERWWTIIPFSQMNPYVNGFAVSDTTVYAATWNGVYRSTDFGNSWISWGLKPFVVNALFCMGPVLFAGTEGRGVYRSFGSSIWSAANTGITASEVTRLTAVDTLLLAGTKQGVFLTSNSSSPWRGNLLGNSIADLASIRNTMFASTSDNPNMYSSTNEGGTWSQANAGLVPNLEVSHILSFSEVLLAGTQLGIYRSTDYGSNWNVENAGLTNWFIGPFAAIGKKIFAETGTGIFGSSDTGQTWRSVTEEGSQPRFRDFAVSGETLFGISENDGLFRSTDQGMRWTPINTGLPAVTSYALLANDSYIFAGTDLGVFLSRSDTIRWVPANSGLCFAVTSLAVLGDTLYAGTTGRSVWRRPLSEMLSLIVSVRQISTSEIEFPCGFCLTQNFPNPFNATTSIGFDVPAQSHVLLQVYNTLGQIVSTLVDDNRSAGVYQVKFDGSNLASGVYFYRMQAGSFIDTKKVLLAK